MDLSICIPTYQRNDQLAELLAGLSHVAPPGDGLRVRVLVIDNNPGGDARQTGKSRVFPQGRLFVHAGMASGCQMILTGKKL
ncbi:MAG: hypothetical protein AAFQ18_11090, partial [Pseudomonadota bacterium]